MFDFFTSDWHIGHKNILGYSCRPFKDIEEHDRELVDRFNYVVHKGSRTLMLGDFCFGSVDRGREIVQALNGEIHLVRGNHDGTRSRMLRMGFASVQDSLDLELAGTHVHCSHYPPYREGDTGTYMERRPIPKPGTIYLHGHTHSPVRIRDNAVHVGVDAWGYYPVGWSDIAFLLWSRGQV